MVEQSLLQPKDKHEYIRELRELFYKRMAQVDFCIGAEQVEKLFREFLGEPEPEITYSVSPSNSRIKASDIINIELENLSQKVTGIFDTDDVLYRKIKNT